MKTLILASVLMSGCAGWAAQDYYRMSDALNGASASTNRISNDYMNNLNNIYNPPANYSQQLDESNNIARKQLRFQKYSY